MILAAACAGAPARVDQPRGAPVIDPAALASIEAQLTRGVWRSSSCGDACDTTELRFLPPTRLEERTGHTLPGGHPTTWSEIMAGTYSMSDAGAVSWAYGDFRHRSTFVDSLGSLGFRASSEAPTRYWHEHGASFGPAYPQRDVEIELVFDAPVEALASEHCGATLRLYAHVVAPGEQPESFEIEDRLRCAVQRTSTTVHIQFEGAPLEDESGQWTAWSTWWQARASTTLSMPMRDALSGAMHMVLIADVGVPLALRSATRGTFVHEE